MSIADRRPGIPGVCAAAALLASLVACSGETSREASADTPAHAMPLNSSGQVSPAVAPGQMSAYAAARFLEQASFGPTPESVARVRQIGLSAWIDEQMQTPVSQIDTAPVRDLVNPLPDWVWPWRMQRFYGNFLGRGDQLRQRVAWSLSQFLVVSDGGPLASAEYMNMLQRKAFGSYAELLLEVTRHPAMGSFLNNVENRPASACPTCSPNENYARELLQLFSVGVNRLNPDGTVMRDSRGRPLPTYSQDDVEDAARALTGWEFDTRNHRVPPMSINWANFAAPMVPATWSAAHDNGEKTVLGRRIPAGQSVMADLDSLIGILMDHPNIAPFVSLRLIQHLVTSNPSPQYVARVAAVFSDDGARRRGNLGAVVKAVLLDPEARRGDTPGATDSRTGKMREPVLWYTGLLRGMGCVRLPAFPGSPGSDVDQVVHPWRQQVMSAPSVFNWYLPTDRTAGTGLLAPEERLLSADEYRDRLGMLNHAVNQNPQALSAAGCSFDSFTQALTRSPSALLDLISDRYLRGAMSPALRATALEAIKARTWGSLEDRTLAAIQFVLASSAYGVMR